MTSDKDLLAMAVSFRVNADDRGIPITVDYCEGPDGPRWAIRKSGFCLSKEGGWEWEPIPSSRTDEFFARCRYATRDEAIRYALSASNPAPIAPWAKRAT